MRQPKPYLRTQTGTWYVQIGKKQIPLAKDEEEAYRIYHELMASRGRSQVIYTSVPHLFDAYLSWVQEQRSEGTYDKVLHYLTSFARHLGAGFTIAKLEPAILLEWAEGQKTWSSTTQNDAISIVQRAFFWAVKRNHIDKSPVAYIEDKPTKKRREVVFNDAEWEEILAEVKDQRFRDLLDFLWLTGCRPLEARTMCAHHVDLKNAVVIFPPSEAKGEKNERVIFLPDKAVEMCKRLLEENPTGILLRNTRGGAWNKDSINSRFYRLKLKLKKPMCAYAARHSYATEGLKQGVDSLTLAQIMGHSDSSMLSKHYAHLSRNPAYLRETARNLKKT